MDTGSSALKGRAVAGGWRLLYPQVHVPERTDIYLCDRFKDI